MLFKLKVEFIMFTFDTPKTSLKTHDEYFNL